MKNLSFMTLLTLIIIVSCQNQTENKKNYNLKRVKMPQETIDKPINLSKFFKQIFFVPLETNENCLIGEISNLKCNDNHIYILDERTISVFIFNKSGKFEKKICTIGKGPNEYLSLMDFDIENDELYLLDVTQRKLLHYNKNMEFVTSIMLQFQPIGFCLTNNGFLFETIDYSKSYNRFILTSRKGEIINKFLPTKYSQTKFNWGESNTFANTLPKTFFSIKFNDVIFELKNKDYEASYEIDFGSKKIPANENINNYNIFAKDFPYECRKSFFVSSKYLFFTYINNGKFNYAWYNLMNNELVAGSVLNDINKIPYMPKWDFDKGFIGSQEAYEIFQRKNIISDNKILCNIKPNDNPALIFYLYKD